MSKVWGILLIVVGGFFMLKVMASFAFLFLLIAAGLAVGAAAGAIGKWGFTAAGIFALLALPMFALKTVFIGLAMVFRLAPILLVIFGIYVLAKAFR